MTRLEYAPCGYIAFHEDQYICDVNVEATRMLERPKPALLGIPVNQVFAARTRGFFDSHVFPALAMHGEIREAYVSLLRPSGEELAAVMNGVCHKSEQGMLLECVFLPMRRRRLFEHELIEGRPAALAAARAEQATLAQLKAAQTQPAMQDQLASLGMLAAGVAHEINNPLSYVAANLELLEAQVLAHVQGQGAELQAMLLEARNGVVRIREIVDSLRSLARVEGSAPHTFVDVQSVVEMATRLAGNEIRHRAQLETQTTSESLVVEGDAGRLGQVLLNLLINAAQALPVGRTENRIVLRVLRERGCAVVEVEDNGPGIPAEIQARIFDPFFTTKPVGVGTGLGLSVCKSIMSALGGTIGVHNGSLGGARFRVTLPLSVHIQETAKRPAAPRVAASAGSCASAQTEPRSRGATSRGMRLLLIDDDEHVTRVMQLALHEFDVHIVNDSRKALAVMKSNTFDVILCDLMMPNVTGIDIYRELLRAHPDLTQRFIFLTGGTFSQDAEAFLNSVANPCLRKPFSTAELRTVCAEMARRLSGVVVDERV